MRRFFFLILAGLYFASSYAQDIDMQALVRETQITRQNAGQLDLVWWIPNEFWAESLRRSGAMQPKQIDEMMNAIDDYVLVAVLEGNLGTLGVLSSTSKEDLEKKTTLNVGKTLLTPIPEADLTPSARTLIQVLKPIITNMIGQMGQGLHFLAFKATDEKGAMLIDARKTGQLTVKVGSKSFDYRLPLAALLPPKVDAQSGEQFPGNYEYNPFTGKKLVTK